MKLANVASAVALVVAAGSACWAELPTTDQLAAWFDAADRSTLFADCSSERPISAAGDRVGCWRSKTGDHTLIQPDAEWRPTYRDNVRQHGVLELADKRDLFYSRELPAVVAQRDWTIFLVTRLNAGLRKTNLLQFEGGGYGRGFQTKRRCDRCLHFQNDVHDLHSGFPEDILRDGVSLDDAWHVFEAVSDNYDLTALLDGALLGSGSLSGQGKPGLSKGIFMIAGDTQKKNTPYSTAGGHVAELVIYERPLTAGERDAVRGYLLAKWGIEP